jgi:hypothetical protein
MEVIVPDDHSLAIGKKGRRRGEAHGLEDRHKD